MKTEMLKHDVLIIGGGSIGLNCAYYLLKSGRGVTILESKEIPQASAAFGNAGQIVPSHIIPLAAPGVVTSALRWMLNPQTSAFGMKIRPDAKYISWLIQFARSCTEANLKRGIQPMQKLGQLSAINFQKLIQEEKIECHYQRTGMITIFKDKKTFEAGVHEGEMLQQHGIEIEVLDKNRLHALEPILRDDVIGGVHCTGDAFLNPSMFLKSLHERVRAMGATIFENTPVIGFEIQNGKIKKVKTETQEFEAEQIILATGAWSSMLARDLKIKIPIQPARGYSVSMSAPKQMPRHSFTLGDKHVAVTPFGNILRATGRLEMGEFSTTPNQIWIHRLENFMREYFDFVDDVKRIDSWAGLRPVTPDGIPIIGKSPLHSNLIVATGHAMVGLTMGPATGQLVSELVNGKETTIDINPFALERFL
jgi:D-amino-acid dehydrogenase